eukprot:5387121-Pyramimonas_sp.AAC.1
MSEQTVAHASEAKAKGKEHAHTRSPAHLRDGRTHQRSPHLRRQSRSPEPLRPTDSAVGIRL